VARGAAAAAAAADADADAEMMRSARRPEPVRGAPRRLTTPVRAARAIGSRAIGSRGIAAYGRWAFASALLAVSAAPVAAQRPKVEPPPPAKAAPIPVDADSAKGDDEAFAALPDPVREVLDVRRQLQPWDGAPGLTCVPLSTTSDGSRRQRVQGRLDDARALVVFARVDRRGALRRVEFVRRLADGGQVSYTWDAEGDATTRTDWPPELTNPSSHPIPRGGPIPRALRGLGRLVMAWPCAPSR